MARMSFLERNTMATLTGKTEMDNNFKYQLKIEVGDTILISSISTSDGWHDVRHSLLHNPMIVTIAPHQAKSDGMYPYRNWVAIGARQLSTGKEIVFKRCQIKLIKKAVDTLPAIEDRRKSMLDMINSKLNIPEPTPSILFYTKRHSLFSISVSVTNT